MTDCSNSHCDGDRHGVETADAVISAAETLGIAVGSSFAFDEGFGCSFSVEEVVTARPPTDGVDVGFGGWRGVQCRCRHS